MSDKIGLFTGSFDPVTLGHIDLIERASHLFDRLYVAIFYNRDKKGRFNLEQRQRMLEEALAGLDHVQVIEAKEKVAAKEALRLGATSLVRGLRNAQDLDYEANLQFYNQDLAPGVSTVYLISQPAYRELSSSRVRELLALKESPEKYVPQSVLKEIMNEKNQRI